MERDNSALTASSHRPLANYHPNVWGDRFLHYTPDESTQGRNKKLVEELKEEVKKELKEASSCNDYIRVLKMVDAIQRLGVEYQFQEEIDECLQHLWEQFPHFCKQNLDIYATALSFRLLRQHGFRVSCEIFAKFKEEEGGLKLQEDEEVVGGVVEFLEATYLRIRGEQVLDKAFVYTRNYLRSMLPTLTINVPLHQQVHHALYEHSNRRGLTRLEARHYMPIYQQYPSHHQSLLALAKLDFNLLQSMHKKELSQLYRWWKALDLSTKLSFARDRLVETYYWVVGVYFEPKYALSRKISTKVQALISIVDDAFDAYATYQELQIFTDAIERWSIACLDKLPDYMKIIYKALLEVGEEIEEEMNAQGKSYRTAYAIEAIKVMVRDYFVEVKWREDKYKPSCEEYMRVGTASCAYTSLIIISFLGMGDVATQKDFDWVLSQPPIVTSSLVISRLSNDIAGHEFEKQREHIPSIVECYMEEENVSKEEAIRELKSQIDESWKELNEAFLHPTQIPAPLLYRILNFARVIESFYYKDTDWYTHVGPEMQSFVRQLFIDRVA